LKGSFSVAKAPVPWADEDRAPRFRRDFLEQGREMVEEELEKLERET